MTAPTEERADGSADRTSGDWPDVGRRPLLNAIGAGAALSVGTGVATAGVDENDDAVDQPEGFETEVVAPHATFTDDVVAAFAVAYEGGAEELAFVRDASTVAVVRATLEPGGTSGWHVDKGPAIAVVVEGAVDVTFEGECVTRTYEAGEALLATGKRADVVENASDDEPATGYIVFLGVPDGEPPSNAVEPRDC